jgi:hypothetical protein
MFRKIKKEPDEVGGLFRKILPRGKASATRTVSTPIGEGISRPHKELGEELEVLRYHRGAVLTLSWHPSLSSAAMVPEVAASLQTYLNLALDHVEANPELKEAVLKFYGIFPMDVYWGREDCDFVIAFAFVGWDDGILRFLFRDGKVMDTDVSD